MNSALPRLYSHQVFVIIPCCQNGKPLQISTFPRNHWAVLHIIHVNSTQTTVLHNSILLCYYYWCICIHYNNSVSRETGGVPAYARTLHTQAIARTTEVRPSGSYFRPFRGLVFVDARGIDKEENAMDTTMRLPLIWVSNCARGFIDRNEMGGVYKTTCIFNQIFRCDGGKKRRSWKERSKEKYSFKYSKKFIGTSCLIDVS